MKFLLVLDYGEEGLAWPYATDREFENLEDAIKAGEHHKKKYRYGYVVIEGAVVEEVE